MKRRLTRIPSIVRQPNLPIFQYPQTGRKRTQASAAPSKGEYTDETLRGQVKMTMNVRTACAERGISAGSRSVL
jgi:hypothetical protein